MCLGVVFGAACTLSHMGAVLKRAVETLPPYQTEVFLAVLEQLRWFAGLQIRNVAVSRALCWVVLRVIMNKQTYMQVALKTIPVHENIPVLYIYNAFLSFQAVGGNIMTASPISDLNPVFMAAGCKLTLMDKGNKHTHNCYLSLSFSRNLFNQFQFFLFPH